MTSEGTLSSETSKKIDEGKLNDFMGKVVNDLGATSSTVLVIIGDKLGTRQWQIPNQLLRKSLLDAPVQVSVTQIFNVKSNF